MALDGIDLAVHPGERVALIGPSGAGKSTLLRILNGLVIPTKGSVRTLGVDPAAVSELERMRLRRRIGMIFQEFALVERLSVRTNVLIGRLGYNHSVASLLHLFPPKDVARADTSLLKVGLAGYEHRTVRQLSGGQKQRVGIARALAQEAELILGDEPTANLDIRTADEVLQLLVNLTADRGATLILSLHDVRAARRFCTRIVALRDGKLVWDGPADAFTDNDLERVFY
jgi:phosphonate transport system ATP-binding protein